MAETSESIADELRTLDVKLKQLNFQYEQYFLGSRPREPVLLRGEVQKIVTRYSNTGIPNTALRFRFNSLCARLFALRRHWDETLRKIEQGTYERHLFKANLREREREQRRVAAEDEAAGGPDPCADAPGGDLFDRYVKARGDCGHEVASITRAKLEQIVARQTLAIQERYGCNEVRFRVVVEDGKAKLKATPVKKGERTGP